MCWFGRDWRGAPVAADNAFSFARGVRVRQIIRPVAYVVAEPQHLRRAHRSMAAVWGDLIARESGQRKFHGRDIWIVPGPGCGPGTPCRSGRCANNRCGLCAVAALATTIVMAAALDTTTIASHEATKNPHHRQCRFGKNNPRKPACEENGPPGFRARHDCLGAGLDKTTPGRNQHPNQCAHRATHMDYRWRVVDCRAGCRYSRIPRSLPRRLYMELRQTKLALSIPPTPGHAGKLPGSPDHTSAVGNHLAVQRERAPGHLGKDGGNSAKSKIHLRQQHRWSSKSDVTIGERVIAPHVRDTGVETRYLNSYFDRAFIPSRQV